ncbi:hypothetical protein TNCV_2420481 [Trichonephila clavipes]|nr:hypothetical protein TNCV_2420481 [Trichonephila clavipes]
MESSKLEATAAGSIALIFASYLNTLSTLLIPPIGTKNAELSAIPINLLKLNPKNLVGTMEVEVSLRGGVNPPQNQICRYEIRLVYSFQGERTATKGFYEN